jgi:drug/metabolite transporter (DMT)-like permease
MPVWLAFIVVVLVWSTTPLGIVWSSESISPTLSLLIRMVLASGLGLLIMFLTKTKLDLRPQAIKVYGYSSISLSVGMLFCYFAAQHISSGLMALSFGLTPVLSGVMAQRWLHEKKFTFIKKTAIGLSFLGLAIVCGDNLQIDSGAIYGITFILIGAILFSYSGVKVKGVKVQMSSLSITVGSLLVSLPVYVLAWWLLDGELNYHQWQMCSIAAVIYMGVFASLLGFLAYFYILKRLDASTVAMTTMLTPLMSLILGVLLNDERFSLTLAIGGALIVTGLGLFLFGNRLVKKFEYKYL